MANLPMESMKTGGIAWFTDLTVPDPYYALPLVTCATMYIMIEVRVWLKNLTTPSNAILSYFERNPGALALCFADGG